MKYFLYLFAKSARVLREQGIGTLINKTYSFAIQNLNKKKFSWNKEYYNEWILKEEPKLFVTDFDFKTLEYKPKISIILPVYNVNPVFLEECIQSIINQTYHNWEICTVDDNSTEHKDEIAHIFNKYSDTLKEKFKYKFSDENQHIALNSNACAELSSGDYLLLVDNDDTLSPFALQEYVIKLNESNYEIIYGDEDYINENGEREQPFFRPEFSPDYLTCTMYMPHFLIKRSLFKELNGFRKGFEGSQDWDLVLRAYSTGIKVAHIAKILYHWRRSSTSTAQFIDNKKYITGSQKKALESYIAENKINAVLENGIWSGSYFFRYKHNNPLVSVIIPNRNNVDLLRKCINSLLNVNKYKNFEILIIENNSTDKDIFEYYEELKRIENIQVLEYKADKKFNYSKVNNFGVKNSKGDLILFLNNDIECIDGEALEIMVENASREEIGAVGCKLIYPNKKIQHAGVALKKSSNVFNPVLEYNSENYMFHGGSGAPINSVRNPDAVTAACLLIDKNKFESVGCFYEKYIIAYQDIDLCLSLRNKGLRILYHPKPVWIHHESVTRKSDFVNLEQNKDFELFNSKHHI
jgi:O-antigen biosynthesis protein